MKGEGFFPVHSELWACAAHMAEVGDMEKTGGYYFHLSQMLFSYLAYEAYLNFIGALVASQEWLNEREFFASGVYHGIKGKLRLIEEKLGITIDRASDPYGTVACLEQFRDFVSHGKAESYAVTLAGIKRSPEMPFNPKLDQWVAPIKAKHSSAQVLALCKIIHDAVKKHESHSKCRRLGSEPFSAVEEVTW